MSGYKKLKIVFLLLFLIGMLTGCGVKEYWEDIKGLSAQQIGTLTLEDLKSAGEENSWTPVEVQRISFERKEHDTYAYDSLTEAEKLWYEDINTMLAYRSDEGVELSKAGIEAGLTQESVDKIYQCVLIDHPEYFYVDGYEYTIFSLAGKLLGIELKGSYTLDLEECLERKAQIEAVAEEILAQAPAQVSDYEKIKFVYEYIIYHTEYDLEAEDNQNIYSVFVGGASVCQGYAKATQYLLSQLNVPCTLVFGKVEEGEPHSWNMVKSDGEYYYLDTTWGDASYTVNGQLSWQGNAPEIKYDYLCVTTNQLSLTHELTHELELPECSATTDNYYIREGCYFIYYDEELLRGEINETLLSGRGMTTLKCDSKDVYEKMYEELIENQKIFEYLSEEHSSVAYIQEEEQLTLTFWVTK
ncbi:MAG: hypothetical protein IJ379_00100 [Lachnospiraceae bacterium]|nr:hypothetical protein [Lachnospiraceae bacterium]